MDADDGTADRRDTAGDGAYGVESIRPEWSREKNQTQSPLHLGRYRMWIDHRNAPNHYGAPEQKAAITK